MTPEEKYKLKVKLQQSMQFEYSELWNSIMFVIDEAIESEIQLAIGPRIEGEDRAHQCGRADGVTFVKELLISTREEAQKKTNRKGA